MAAKIMDDIVKEYQLVHELVLLSVSDLDDDQIKWQMNETTPSIGFYIWHLGRWADVLHASLTKSGEQIWDIERLAERWGFDKSNLGFANAGMGMADDVFASLPLPKKDDLLDYTKKAFVASEQAVAKIDDNQFHHKAQDPVGFISTFKLKGITIGQIILMEFRHESQHLGMIECLLGVMGMHGSAIEKKSS